ncbi:hypothetical protein [Paenibacillus sp. UNC499MF]|uniref:hypothetical protein n=1 Tax=Paenibacillus sp. UNC499MF TaxID=1502751 RepID=UPI0015E1F7A2|nr:hypothetical protein [Paenibacillus sp. UNC499MF]
MHHPGTASKAAAAREYAALRGRSREARSRRAPSGHVEQGGCRAGVHGASRT